MSNPISGLRATEKLTGENFNKWKSNMNIVLVCENYKFVLVVECPEQPAANATRAVREAYDKWINANSKARCYLLAGMSEVLRTKHELMETAFEIIESLQQMFEPPSNQSRHEAMKAIMNAKMKVGSSIREQVLKMISHINEAELHGVTINEAT